MKVQITADMTSGRHRECIGDVRDVYLKLYETWYIISDEKMRTRDRSPVRNHDQIAYQREGHVFIPDEDLPKGYTWIHKDLCQEILDFKTNEEALCLLRRRP